MPKHYKKEEDMPKSSQIVIAIDAAKGETPAKKKKGKSKRKKQLEDIQMPEAPKYKRTMSMGARG